MYHNEINHLKTLIIKAVKHSKDAALLDLILKLLITKSG